ncbi:protein-disulfide reductase DsbD domain-containing protein [Devosia sp. CAU 1758]
MRYLLACALCLFAPVLPAIAGETAWQEVAPGVSIRLISAGQVDAAGKALFALEIDMPDDTKTYWLVPGETGLPTQLDFSASRGIAGHNLHWPYPIRHESGGYLDYVYFGRTVLPMELSVTDHAGLVDMEATLGICSDICVPAQARLVLPAVDGTSDAANELRIRQALAEVPIPWDTGPEPVGAVHLLADGTEIAVEIDGAVVDSESLIAAGGPGAPIFGAPQKSPQQDLVLLPIIGKNDNNVLEGMRVDLSFMTTMGAYKVGRTIESGTDANADALGQ